MRDNVPTVIRKDGAMPNVRTMEADEYRRELLYKLIEEAEDLRQAGYDAVSPAFLTEAADVAEVFDAILKEFGITRDDLDKARAVRRDNMGGLDEKIFLESVEDDGK